MNAIDILDRLLDYTGENRSSLARRIGVIPQRFHDIANGKTKAFSYEIADKITTAFPEVDKNFLLTGEGSMLAGGSKVEVNEKKLRASQVINYLIYKGIAKTQKEIGDMLGYGESYFSQIISGAKPLSDGVLVKLLTLDKGKEINLGWLLTGEGTMLAGEQEVKANAKELDPEALNWISVPVIPFRAMAGSTGWYEDVFADEWKEKRTVIAPLGAKAIDHAIFTVTGDSMEPTLIEGDEILAKHVPFDCYKENRLRIYNYSIWIIATKSEGILIKNITEHDVENHTITCHSFNDKYSDFVLDLSDVKDIYHIVSLTRNY